MVPAPCGNLALWCPLEKRKAEATRCCREITYVLEGDDVWVLAVPQQNLNLFRGVPFTLIDDLEQTERGP